MVSGRHVRGLELAPLRDRGFRHRGDLLGVQRALPNVDPNPFGVWPMTDCADLFTLAYMDGNAVARASYERAGFIEIRRQVDAKGGPDDVWMGLRPRAELQE